MLAYLNASALAFKYSPDLASQANILTYLDLFLLTVVVVYVACKSKNYLESSLEIQPLPSSDLHKMSEFEEDQPSEESVTIQFDSAEEKRGHFYVLMLGYSLSLGAWICSWGYSVCRSFSFEVRFGQQVVLGSLFVWSLFAPRLCPNREFRFT